MLQLIDVPDWFLINMFLRVGFSRCLQVLVQGCGFHAARGESEWCILLWCLVAQTAAARHLSSCWRLLLSSTPHMCKSTELLWHKTLDFTLDVAYQQTRRQFCRLPDMDSHSGMCLSETARDVKHCRWVVIINVTYYISQVRAETSIRRGGQFCCSFVANLLQ